jgi:hypothetical protein
METPQGQTRLVDAIECSCRAELIGGLVSKIAANVIYLLQINALRGFECTDKSTSVAKSLQPKAKKKAYEDQSLA